MAKYQMDILATVTLGVIVEAASKEEAEEKAGDQLQEAVDLIREMMGVKSLETHD